MTAFFIIRDITEQKRVEEERALEEERYNIALRNTYTEIYEIDLSTDTPHLVYAAETPMIPVDHDKNGNIHTIAATLMHPEGRDRKLIIRSMECLMRVLIFISRFAIIRLLLSSRLLEYVE